MNNRLSIVTVAIFLCLSAMTSATQAQTAPGNAVRNATAQPTGTRTQTTAAQANAKPANVQLAGQNLVQAAVERTSRYRTIEARMRVRTDLMGQPLIGSGRYAQLASTVGPLLRLELAIQAGEQATSVKQISDGRDLWEYWRIGGKERLNQIDLRRVHTAIRKAPAGTISTATSASLATGGLPKLLSQLDENFDFNTTPTRSGTIGNAHVIAVNGVWKGEKLAATAPQAVEGDTIYFEKLPVHLPHQVEILIGTNELFPYRVTYQQWQMQDGKRRLKPVVTTEFFDVAFDESLDPTQFQFKQPDNIKSVDRTDVFLRSLGLAPTEIARKPEPRTR